MGELLAPEGVWDVQLVELMLPVAIKLEADETQRMYGAMSAAVGGLFDGKVGKKFAEGMKVVQESVRGAQLAARGRTPATPDAATSMLTALRKIGFHAKGPRRPGRKRE